MKIAHFLVGRVNPDGTNGGDRVIYHLARATAEMGEEVLIVGLSAKLPLPVGRAMVRYFAPPRNPFSLPSAVNSALLEFRPDVVHFHDLYNPSSGILARWLREKEIPYAVSVHGALMPGALSRHWAMKAAYLRLLGRSYLRHASLVHAVSAAEAGALGRFAPGVPSIVAHHGIERVDVHSLDSGYLRRRCRAVEGKRILGFLGRLDPFIKGLDLLVKGYAHARESLDDVCVVLAGPDWRGRAAALHQLIKRLRLADRFHFLGPILGKERFHFLASCDAVVLPSRSEAGLPLSVLEAFETGKPCLVSTAANPAEFFRRYRAGIQISPTVEGVAEGLRYFVSADADDLEAMGRQGLRGVRQEFSWNRTAAKLLRSYERACLHSGPGSGRAMVSGAKVG